MTAKLQRTTLKTSRLLDYCSAKGLALETGHGQDEWPLVIVKELLDNGVDSCEDTGTPPKIVVMVNEASITVSDNGSGIPPETVAGVLDFAARISSREHYVSPTRGAQGNALKTVVAIPFVLDGQKGNVEIIARGIRHDITLQVDRIRQEPVIDHQQHRAGSQHTGTSVTVHWPNLASITLRDAKAQILQIVDSCSFLNPHLSLTVDCFCEHRQYQATTPNWRKWNPSDPTSAHWYTLERFERLLCGYLAHDADNGRERLVREVVAEFDGLTATAKQKAVLDATGLARQPLSALRNCRELDHNLTGQLLAEMKAHSKPVKPQRLGALGKDHLAERFQSLGCEMKSFVFKVQHGMNNDLPFLVETAFAWRPNAAERRLITGVNWSPAIRNPFRKLGRWGESLDSVLAQMRASSNEPVVLLLHVACPRVTYADRGKSQILTREGNDDSDECDP